MKQAVLCMLKNISQIIKRKKKLPHADCIKVRALKHKEIPAKVYEMLGLSASEKSQDASTAH